MRMGRVIVLLLLIASLGAVMAADYEVVIDPTTSVLWKLFVVCAGTPVLVVLSLLAVTIVTQGGGKNG